MKYACFITAILSLVFLAGCDESISTKPPAANVHNLRQRALGIIRAGLKDENGLVRSHAIEVVSVTRTEEFMPTVAVLLSDQSVAVRFAAAVAIGDLSYSPAAGAVKRLLNESNENTKMASAYALAKLGKTEYSNIIRSFLKSKDQTVRANSALLLGKIGDRNDIPLLYQTLQDPYSLDKVKIQSIESIARLGDKNIYRGKLWALLISKQADDRVMGVRAMGALGTFEAKNAIATILGNDALEGDDVLEVRLCAAEELGRLGDTTGASEILNYFTEKSPNLDRASVANIIATMAIGRLGGPSLTRFLPRLMQSKSKEVQLSAAQSVLLLTN
jgi:HEAT repeat protein